MVLEVFAKPVEGQVVQPEGRQAAKPPATFRYGRLR
jgi:hypothetical protein